MRDPSVIVVRPRRDVPRHRRALRAQLGITAASAHHACYKLKESGRTLLGPGNPTKDGVAMNEPTTPSEADGVLVASAWRTSAGDVLVRITMTRPGDDGDTVSTVSTTAEAVSRFEDWLTELTP